MAFNFPEDKQTSAHLTASPTAGTAPSGSLKHSRLTSLPWRIMSRLTTDEGDQTRQDDAFAAGQEAQDLAASELTNASAMGNSSSGRLSWP